MVQPTRHGAWRFHGLGTVPGLETGEVDVKGEHVAVSPVKCSCTHGVLRSNAREVDGRGAERRAFSSMNGAFSTSM